MNKRDINWEELYILTFNFFKKYNYYPIYNKNNKNNTNKIANWICFQKNKYDKKQLNNYKIEKLQKLPNWKWNNIKIIETRFFHKEDIDDPIQEFDEPEKIILIYSNKYYDI